MYFYWNILLCLHIDRFADKFAGIVCVARD